MKIALIGPFPPYRGGISMFNFSLAKELKKHHDIYKISFSLQYPKYFFPGKSQKSSFQDNDIIEIINSINPFSWRKTANYINKISPDVIIFQYWMPFFAPAFTLIAKKTKRACNSKIIVNCNNIVPHEPKKIDSILTRNFFKHCDSFIVMSDTVEKDLLKINSQLIYKKTPHPIYDLFGKSLSKDEARKVLKIGDEKLILNFGLVRNYKGLDILIKSAKILKKQLNKFKIMVVGECYENQSKYIQMAKDNNVEDVIDFNFEFIPNENVKYFFCASDLVVLPYKSATQSGIIPIAYHFNKPVVASNVGGLPENIENNKTGIICEPNPESIANGILDYFDSDLFSYKENIEKYKKQYTWETFAKKIMELV
mgnify:FL=1